MDKKQFKRVWSLLLCVVLLLGNVPVVSAEGENHGVVEQLADHTAENQAAADAVAAAVLWLKCATAKAKITRNN